MSEPADPRDIPPCPSCGNAGRPTTTDLVFSDGEVTVRVEGVAAVACDACGETFVDGRLGVQIGDEVAAVLRLLRESRAQAVVRATTPKVVVLTASSTTRDAA